MWFRSAGNGETYNNIMRSSNAGSSSVTCTVNFTVPQNVKEGIIVFSQHYYTAGGAYPTITIPDGVYFEELMPMCVIGSDSAYDHGNGTNNMHMRVIKAKNIANKTFSLVTSQGFNRGYIWLLY